MANIKNLLPNPYISWSKKYKGKRKKNGFKIFLTFLYDIYYNLGHNILRFFDVLPNFSFTTSEANRDY